MQTRATILVFLISLVPAQALAFGFSISARTPTSGLAVGDSVVVDVFFDADQTNVWLASVGVLVDDSLSYDFAAGELLPVVYPAPPPAYGTSGSQPGYILYSPAGADPASWLKPVRKPWAQWTGTTPAGKVQTNIDYWSNDALSTPPLSTHVTGSGIWIASLVLNVDQPFVVAEVSLAMTSANLISQVVDAQGTTQIVDNSAIALSSPIYLTPEPGTALLLGLGLLAAATASRRRGRAGVLSRD